MKENPKRISIIVVHYAFFLLILCTQKADHVFLRTNPFGLGMDRAAKA